MDYDGTLIHSKGPRLEGLAKHFRELFRWHTTIVGLPLLSVGKSLRVVTKPPSKMEAIREIGLLKVDKAAGRDGQPLSFLKVEGKVLKSE